MANIIRCVLPDGVHRFKPFKVSDYRDFLLVRNDMLTKSEEIQIDLIDELAGDYFGEYPKSWQSYIFLSVFTGSIGKTKIPIVYDCPICGKTHKKLFNISQDDLVNPRIKIDENAELIFKIPENIYHDSAKMIYDNIEIVIFNDIEYKWDELDEDTQSNIIDMIDIEKFEEIVKKLKPIHFELVLKCCDTRTIVYDDLMSIFKLLINPDEVFSFYEINHILTKNSYDLNAVMNMLPAERSIALSLIERDRKDKK